MIDVQLLGEEKSATFQGEACFNFFSAKVDRTSNGYLTGKGLGVMCWFAVLSACEAKYDIGR